MQRTTWFALALVVVGNLAFAQAPAVPKDVQDPSTTNQKDLHPDEGPPKKRVKAAKKAKAAAAPASAPAATADAAK